MNYTQPAGVTSLDKHVMSSAHPSFDQLASLHAELDRLHARLLPLVDRILGPSPTVDKSVVTPPTAGSGLFGILHDMASTSIDRLLDMHCAIDRLSVAIPGN
jgi:hypothetical protein